VTKTLGTRDAVLARQKATPVLATFQRQISQAEAIYGAEKTGEVAPVLLTLSCAERQSRAVTCTSA
jgi:hypothetical protein